MQLQSVAVKNFRCYRDEVVVPIGDLTTFVGRNDIGKSSILEALEIFFNNETVRIEAGDANIFSGDSQVTITCEFSALPEKLTLDAGAETTLKDEYLLTGDGTLKIRKVYECKSKPSVEVYLLAHHPMAPSVAGLLEFKEKELQKIVKDKGLTAPLKGNPGMRKAIWEAEANLQLADDVAIPVSKPKEDSKRIWDQLEAHLPLFALFQSDRSSRDSDGEVQNPMKAAIQAALAEMQDEIAAIQDKVREKAVEIANDTQTALNTIDPNLARELNPQFVPPTAAKWTGLFAINMDTDDGIPLNKRGSGVRRLVLVSFFKATAERRLATSSKRGIIYAIEEPETAQHPSNQQVLIEAFTTIAADPGSQVILTTHSPGFASELTTESIRYVHRDATTGNPKIEAGADVFGAVAEALGVVPDSRVKLLLCVEGPTDVDALRSLSRALHLNDPTIPDLTATESVAFIVLGGSTLKHWVAEHYLKALHRPEVHIYDSDVESYSAAVAAVNQRGDKSWGVQTSKYEIENYLHTDAIAEAFGVQVNVGDGLDANGLGVPALFAQMMHIANPVGCPMKDGTAKKKLSAGAFPLMTAARIAARDPLGEVEGWFRRIGTML